MAKWEERERRADDARRKESVSLLREKLSHEDGKVRRGQASLTAEQAVRIGTGMPPSVDWRPERREK